MRADGPGAVACTRGRPSPRRSGPRGERDRPARLAQPRTDARAEPLDDPGIAEVAAPSAGAEREEPRCDAPRKRPPGRGARQRRVQGSRKAGHGLDLRLDRPATSAEVSIENDQALPAHFGILAGPGGSLRIGVDPERGEQLRAEQSWSALREREP